MKDKEQKEIIEILEHHQSLLGVNKERVGQLISCMKSMKTQCEIDITMKEEIKRYFQYLSEKIGYDYNESNNKIRQPEIATERFVMYHVAVKKYGRTSTLDEAAIEYFEKDRTTMLYWLRRSKELIEVKDHLFMFKMKKIFEEKEAA